MRLFNLILPLVAYAVLCLFKAHVFWNATGFQKNWETFFWTESAMHLYLTEKVVKGEDLTGIDQRAQFPEGLNLGKDITMGMPLVIGTAYNWVSPEMPLDIFVAWFQIFFSSLTVIAIYLLAKSLYGSTYIAFLTAILYSVSTAAIARTAGGYLYEDFSLPFLMFGFFAFIQSLNKDRAWWMIIPAVLFGIALNSWHFSQFLLLSFALVLAASEFRTRTLERNKEGILVFSATLLLICLASPLLRADGIFAAPMISLFLALALYSWLDGRPLSIRLGAPLFLLVLMAIAYSQLGYEDESHVFKILLEKLRFGLHKPADPNLLSFETRTLWIEDDNSPNLYALVLLSSFFLVSGIFGAIRLLMRPQPIHVFTGLMTLGLTALYFMARRMVTVDVIFLALSTGALLTFSKRAFKIAATALLICCGIFEACKSWPLNDGGEIEQWANSLSPAAEPNLATQGDHLDIVAWVKANTFENDPILAPIGLSSVILLRTHRPIILHSKFESLALREKYMRYLKDVFGREEDFFKFFKDTGAKYFILEAKAALFNGPDSYRYMSGKLDLDQNSAVFKMHFRPETLSHLELIYQNPTYRVFREKKGLPQPPLLNQLIYNEAAFSKNPFNEVIMVLQSGRNRMRMAFQMGLAGLFPQAISEWTDLKKSQPGIPEINAYLCFAHMAVGEMKQAQEECAEELKYYPHSRTGLYHSGILNEQMRDFAKAKDFYERALAIDPRYKPPQEKLNRLLGK